MFTGIIETVGTIANSIATGGDRKFVISCPGLDFSDVQLGDSIAVNGVCLTVVEFTEDSFTADVSNETLAVSSLAGLTIGSSVNLEKALRLADRLGGHMVSGHVDGLGEIIGIYPDGRSRRYQVKVKDGSLLKYIAPKGSITVDGTSLTVNKIDGDVFDLNIVPHTWERTIIGTYQKGSIVNLEVDVIARYLERLMQSPSSPEASSSIDEAFLVKHGFLGR